MRCVFVFLDKKSRHYVSIDININYVYAYIILNICIMHILPKMGNDNKRNCLFLSMFTSWHLYKMVAQNTCLSRHLRKYFKFEATVGVKSCLKQIELPHSLKNMRIAYEGTVFHKYHGLHIYELFVHEIR